MSGWISVKERLPEPGVSVLVWVPESANHDGGYTIDMIDPESDGDLWFDHYEHGVPKEYAPYTHWQPLPEPPKNVVIWTLNTCDTKVQFPDWMKANEGGRRA